MLCHLLRIECEVRHVFAVQYSSLVILYNENVLDCSIFVISPSQVAYAFILTNVLEFTPAANKRRIVDMGGMEILLTLCQSDNDRIRQQAGKAITNLDANLSIGK